MVLFQQSSSVPWSAERGGCDEGFGEAKGLATYRPGEVEASILRDGTIFCSGSMLVAKEACWLPTEACWLPEKQRKPSKNPRRLLCCPGSSRRLPVAKEASEDFFGSTSASEKQSDVIGDVTSPSETSDDVTGLPMMS